MAQAQSVVNAHAHVATIPYGCRLLMWWLMDLDVVAQNLLYRKNSIEACGVTHVCVHTPTYTV